MPLITPTVDEKIETAVVNIINTLISGVGAEARKLVTLREGESVPKILIACRFEHDEPGENGDNQRRNAFYVLNIVLFTKSNQASTGNALINEWRQAIVRALFGPEIPAVPEVDNITMGTVPPVTMSKQPEGVFSQVLEFTVETYEPIG